MLQCLESSDESLRDVDVIVPEDGKEQIERVMLPHIEEVNQLIINFFIKYLLNITSMQTHGAEVQARVNTCPKATAASGGYMTASMATLEGVIDEERVTKFECGPS